MIFAKVKGGPCGKGWFTCRENDQISKCIKGNGFGILTIKKESSKYKKRGNQNEPWSVKLELEVLI